MLVAHIGFQCQSLAPLFPQSQISDQDYQKSPATIKDRQREVGGETYLLCRPKISLANIYLEEISVASNRKVGGEDYLNVNNVQMETDTVFSKEVTEKQQQHLNEKLSIGL